MPDPNNAPPNPPTSGPGAPRDVHANPAGKPNLTQAEREHQQAQREAASRHGRPAADVKPNDTEAKAERARKMGVPGFNPSAPNTLREWLAGDEEMREEFGDDPNDDDFRKFIAAFRLVNGVASHEQVMDRATMETRIQATKMAMDEGRIEFRQREDADGNKMDWEARNTARAHPEDQADPEGNPPGSPRAPTGDAAKGTPAQARHDERAHERQQQGHAQAEKDARDGKRGTAGP